MQARSCTRVIVGLMHMPVANAFSLIPVIENSSQS